MTAESTPTQAAEARRAEIARLHEACMEAQNLYSVEVAKNGIKVRQQMFLDVLAARKRKFSDELTRHTAALVAREEERDELQQLFDLRWEADMRAIKRWQEAHPGNDLVWPDGADLVVWLMEKHAERTP